MPFIQPLILLDRHDGSTPQGFFLPHYVEVPAYPLNNLHVLLNIMKIVFPLVI